MVNLCNKLDQICATPAATECNLQNLNRNLCKLMTSKKATMKYRRIYNSSLMPIRASSVSTWYTMTCYYFISGDYKLMKMDDKRYPHSIR